MPAVRRDHRHAYDSDWWRSPFLRLACLLGCVLCLAIVPFIHPAYRADALLMAQDRQLRPVIVHELNTELETLLGDRVLLRAAGLDAAGKTSQEGPLRGRVVIEIKNGLGLIDIGLIAAKPLQAMTELRRLLHAYEDESASRYGRAETNFTVMLWPNAKSVRQQPGWREAVACLALLLFGGFIWRDCATWFAGRFRSAREAERKLGIRAISVNPAQADNGRQAVSLADDLLLLEAAQPARIVLLLGENAADCVQVAHRIATDLAVRLGCATLLLDLQDDGPRSHPPLRQAVRQGETANLWIGDPTVSSYLLTACAVAQGRDWIDGLGQRFDRVVICAGADTPSAAEIRLLSLVDGVMLVIRGQHSAVSDARLLATRVMSAGGRLLGMVYLRPAGITDMLLPLRHSMLRAVHAKTVPHLHADAREFRRA